MSNKKIVYSILFSTIGIILLYFIIPKKSDAEKAAIEYCNCLLVNDVNNKSLVAQRFCDAKIIANYALYKYYVVDIRYSSYYPINDSIAKSAKQFHDDFTDYCILHCCKEVNGCNLLNDTFFIKNSKVLSKNKR